MGRMAKSLLLFIAVCSAEPPSWRTQYAQQKQELVARHPLFGRTIGRAELPALYAIFRAARALPMGSDFSIAYLIQGEEDTSSKEAAMWSANSDCFVLTFRTQRGDALFFPNSRLAEGRNVLLAAAALEELRKGYRYRYYAMLDGDVSVAEPWDQAVSEFERFLVEWEPAVGMPGYGQSPLARKGGTVPHAIYHFDHIFIAVHTDAAPSLLPYQPEFDQECAWVSQWMFTLQTQALYRNHTLMFPRLHVHNPAHGEYPRQDCYAHMRRASERMRELAPSHARRCFPDPAMGRFLFAPNWLGPSSYIPWATAKRKQEGTYRADYFGAGMHDVEPCDSEMQALHQYAMPRTSRFCAGCPPEAIIYYLQTQIMENPLWGPNWHELSIVMWGTLGDVPLARACVAISDRLEQLRGRSVEAVGELVEVLDYDLRERGMASIADQFVADWLWSEGKGRAVIEKAIRAAMLSVHFKDEDDPFLFSEEQLEWLWRLLKGDKRALGERPPMRPLPPGMRP